MSDRRMCQHPSTNRYCVDCVPANAPATLKILALRERLCEELQKMYREYGKETHESMREVVREAMMQHELLVLEPYAAARARAQAARAKNYGKRRS